MNKYYEIDYKLYTVENGVRTLAEETTPNDPFKFITGFGTTIPGFETNIENLEAGADFDFTIAKADAFGDHVEERVIELPRPEDESQFDLSIGAIVPLQNADGTRFNAQIIGVTDTKVKLDLNHPLAGKDLNFAGKILTAREATNEEIQSMINALSGGCGGCGGGGCGGGGCKGNCGGDCGGDCNEGDCNCNS